VLVLLLFCQILILWSVVLCARMHQYQK
jgi:hypothetical protein